MLMHIVIAVLVLLFIHELCMREQKLMMMMHMQWQTLEHLADRVHRLRCASKHHVAPPPPPPPPEVPQYVPPVPRVQHSYDFILHPFTQDEAFASDPVSDFFRSGTLSETPHRPEHSRLRNQIDFMEDTTANSGYGTFVMPPESPRAGVQQVLAQSPRRTLQKIDSDSDDDIEDTYMQSLR